MTFLNAWSSAVDEFYLSDKTDAELTALLDASWAENKTDYDEWTEFTRIWHEKSRARSAYRAQLFEARNKLRGYPALPEPFVYIIQL